MLLAMLVLAPALQHPHRHGQHRRHGHGRAALLPWTGGVLERRPQLENKGCRHALDEVAPDADVTKPDQGRVFGEDEIRRMCTACTESISKTGEYCVFWAEATAEAVPPGWPFVACAGKGRDDEMLKYRLGDHPNVEDVSPVSPGVPNPKCEGITLEGSRGGGGGVEGGSAGGSAAGADGDGIYGAVTNLWLVTHPWVAPWLDLMSRVAVVPMV